MMSLTDSGSPALVAAISGPRFVGSTGAICTGGTPPRKARQVGLVKTGEPHIVAGWGLAEQGRQMLANQGSAAPASVANARFSHRLVAL